jgi:benzoylformate decarboxylase
MGDGSMHYAITALWSAANYNIPVTIVVASNAEYGILKQFGAIEHTTGIPGLDLPGFDIVATASSYGVNSRRQRTRMSSRPCSETRSSTEVDHT